MSAAIDRVDDQLAKAQGYYAPTQQAVSVNVETAPVLATAEWLRQMTAVAGETAQPAALSSPPIVDAEVIP